MAVPPLGTPAGKSDRHEGQHWCGGTLVFSRATPDRSHSRERCNTCGWQYGFTTGR